MKQSIFITLVLIVSIAIGFLIWGLMLPDYLRLGGPLVGLLIGLLVMLLSFII